jgi:DNA (cytosine-5)-methyltransferase 1
MLKAISLYTGVGGLDFGFEAAGFETVAAVEMDPVACRTMQSNRKWNVLEGKIAEITSKDILKAAQLRVGEPDVLIGGPPCQPFSKSSYWVSGDAARLDDPRADTLTEFFRVLRDTRPRAFLLENVPGLAYKDKDEGLRHVLEILERINHETKTHYEARHQVLNAADYGVPQLRQRLFIVGSRDGTPFEFPRPTHAEPGKTDLLQGQLQPYRNAWDALGDLPDPKEKNTLALSGRWADLLSSVPEGHNYLWHTNRGGGEPIFGWRSRYWSFLLKLKKTLPAWTIQAQPGPAIGPFHWKNRKLSATELARLQTFPDDIRFDCSRSDVQRLVGNAVPSLLTEVLARAMREQLLGEKPRNRAPKLLPPVRTPVPPAERVRSVPTQYHDLIGNHPDHPGEGRGAGALKRAERTGINKKKSADTQRTLFAEAE